MATADEIRAAIAAEQRSLRQGEQDVAASMTQISEAQERLELRKELNQLRERRASQKRTVLINQYTAEDLDDDDAAGTKAKVEARMSARELGECAIRCDQDVISKVHLWKIEGMSWLTHHITNNDADTVSTPHSYTVAETGDEVDFVYHPCRGVVGTFLAPDGCEYCASLAMRFWKDTGSTFRYRVFIRRSDGEFVQWGPQGDERHSLDTFDMRSKPFGPDVGPAPRPAAGVFGLSHAELLQSEWVHDDVLTVRFELELRPPTCDDETLVPKRQKVSVPPPSLVPNLLSFLEEGKRSDMVFVVKGERLKAHSLVLAASCEVFDSLLQSGMRESESKEVVLEDCDPDVFRAFLRYLYSDDFSQVETRMESLSAKSCSDDGEAGALATKATFLHGVLSVSHKYQVSRLALWCQQQLGDLISVESVCATWLQAYLHEAKHG